MDYSAALRKNLGASPPSHKSSYQPAPLPTAVAPEAEPEVEEEAEVVHEEEENIPVPVEEEEQEAEEEQVDLNEMEEGQVVGGGYFGWVLEEEVLSEQSARTLVAFLGPSGLCLLARTCRFLFRAVFTSAKPLWSYLALPEPSEVFVKFFIDISPVEDGQKENVSSVPLSQVKSEYQKNQLVKYWIRTVSNAHAAREKQIEQSKKDDPLVSDKLPIKAVLKGGFAFYLGKADKPLAKVNDLSQVPKWLEGVYGLIKSSDKAVTVPSEEGGVTLARVGRGGHLLSVTTKASKGEKETTLFDFGAFSEALRKISKDYLRVVGSCRSKLTKTHNAPQLPAFPEIQKFIEVVMAHNNLNAVLKNIKNDLRKGAIPHSTLPDYYKRKLKEKAQRNEQATSENGSIVNFLLSNLPPSLEEAKKTRDALDRKLKKQIENEVEERRVAREERIQKEREARRAAFEAEKAQKEGKKPKEVEKEKEKKEKYKVQKEVGADGFETKVLVDADGKKIKQAKKAAVEATEKPVKVKVPESVSATQNPFKPALLAGDSGIEIKEPKPAPAQTKKPQQKPEEPKKETKPAKKTEEPKKEAKPAKKTEESKKEVTEVAAETAPKPKADKKTKTKAENKDAKKDKKVAKGKKPKSEEDQGSRVVAKSQPSLTEAPWFTPTLALFLLVLAVSALYTLFLS